MSGRPQILSNSNSFSYCTQFAYLGGKTKPFWALVRCLLALHTNESRFLQGNLMFLESPKTLPAPFTSLFEYEKQFRNWNFAIRTPTKIYSSDPSFSGRKAATDLAFKQTLTRKLFTF